MFDLDAVIGHARDLADHRLGIVTIAALPSIAAEVLPRAIRALVESGISASWCECATSRPDGWSSS